jgi:hypothetical protein
MKNTCLVLLLTAISFGAVAQKNSSKFSIGVEAGLPIGENGDQYSSIIGGSLQYENMPASDMGITLNAGYLHYMRKSSLGGGSIGFVPLLAGVKYYFSPSPRAFFHAQLGAAFGTNSGQGTSFAYSPGIGIHLNPNIDAELKYMGISNKGGTLDNVGLRVGFNF